MSQGSTSHSSLPYLTDPLTGRRPVLHSKILPILNILLKKGFRADLDFDSGRIGVENAI